MLLELVTYLSCYLPHESHYDRHKRHEQRKHDSREEICDHTKNDLWTVVDKLQKRGDFCEIRYLGDGTDKSNGDRPDQKISMSLEAVVPLFELTRR